MNFDPTQYRAIFCDEATEHVALLEGALLRLEADPATTADAVDEAFRSAHTIKGGADAIGFPGLAQFTHGLEELLGRFRGRDAVPRPVLDLLLEGTDGVARYLVACKAGEPPPPDLEGLSVRFRSESERAVAAPAPAFRYAVSVTPAPDAFRCGLDPLRLLRELATLGTVSEVALTAEPPPLPDLDPEACYLAWSLVLETDRPPSAVGEVFEFAREKVRVTVTPIAEEVPVSARPVGSELFGGTDRESLGDRPDAVAAAPVASASVFVEVPDPPLPPPPDVSVLDDYGPMIGEFCQEADEHLEAADRNLLTIDADPTNAEALNAVYRGFHTIKGVSSMLGLSLVQMLAHEAESLLNLAREGKVVLSGKPLDLVFLSTDAMKRQIRGIRKLAEDRVPMPEDPGLGLLLADLRAVAAPSSVAQPRPASAPPPAAARAETAVAPVESPPASPKVEPVVAKADPHARRDGGNASKETVRVDKDRLDKLINTIGELVIAQSMAQQEFDELNGGTGAMSLALPELSKISRDLQELSLSLRMVPLQGTFQKMARLVRDLSRKMDKPVELELHGEETELDKTVVDQLGDPLMHMVRNAVDHGLEDPAERVAAGKPATGHVTLKAYHQGGSVYIELSDDGKGMDRERLVRKAVEKGIVQEGQRLSDAEAYALIFAPGFSTAAAVTDVSGRGVGMDVVRRNVEALQGNILISTKLGSGTTFSIRLPLTLAIMDGLMVSLGEDVYVLPLLSVIESFRPRPADLHTIAARGEAVTVRGEVVPLLRLHQLLGRPARMTDPCQALVVLMEDQGKKHALLVDELLGQMQAVVKSLDSNYKRVDGLAGATILGDGRVAMILDIHGLTQLHTQTGGGVMVPATTTDDLFGDLA